MLEVERQIWERFPGMRLVVLRATGVDSSRGADRAAAALVEAVDELARGWAWPNIQSHPRVGAWRDALKSLDLRAKKFPSSIESLGRRALKGPIGSINPVVDFYNAVSLRHLVPAGGWDRDRLEGRLRLAMTRGGESFRPLGGTVEELVEPAEVAYLCGEKIVTRHFVWRQAEAGKLRAESRRIVLVSEVLGDLPAELPARVQRDLVEGLESLFGASVTSEILTAEGPYS